MNRLSTSRSLGQLLVVTVILAVILGYLFANSFKPDTVVISNDGAHVPLTGLKFGLPTITAAAVSGALMFVLRQPPVEG